jgi:hypothetical protein
MPGATEHRDRTAAQVDHVRRGDARGDERAPHGGVDRAHEGLRIPTQRSASLDVAVRDQVEGSVDTTGLILAVVGFRFCNLKRTRRPATERLNRSVSVFAV